MSNGIRITRQTIKIDQSRRVDCPLNAKVLLYDAPNDCYYETTIEHICGALVRRIDGHFEELAKQTADNFRELSNAVDDRVAEVERKTAEFIEDTAKVNQSLIEMVEHSDNN